MKFHRTVARVVTEMCQLLAAQSGVKEVALSGGTFQNRLLLSLTRDALDQAGFTVLVHSDVPTNDGGVSLGQAVIASLAAKGA